MKKLLLALPLIAGGSWAGASYYTGAQTQQAYDQLLSQLNELKPFTLVNEHYTAGITNSTAITSVMDSAAANAVVLFRLHHDINHSPIRLNNGNVRVGPATIKTTLLRDEALPEPIQNFLSGFDNQEAVQLNTEVSFEGTLENRLLVSVYQHQIDDVNVRFDGMDYTFSMDGNRFTGAGTAGELVLSSDGNIVRLTAGDMTHDMTRISQAIFAGTYSLSFDKLSVSGPQIPVTLAMKSIELSSDTSVQDHQLNTTGRFAVGNIDSPLPLNRAELEVQLSALSLTGLEQTIQLIAELSVTASMVATGPELADRVLKTLLNVVGPGTGLSMGMLITNEDGQGTLDTTIRLVDGTSANYPVAGLATLTTLRDILNALQFEWVLQADTAAIDRTPLAIFTSTPEAQQFFVSDGLSYRSNISVKDLLIDINGNPMSLETVLGEFLDTPLASAIDMLP